MKVCYRCGGKFGLIRYTLLTFSGYLPFCSRLCKQAYQKEIRKEVKRRKHLKWLHEETGTS